MAVTGEAGIGKTRLVNTVIEDVRRGGATVLASQGVDRVGARLPYGLITQMLRQCVRHFGAQRLRDLLGAEADVLASLVPSVGTGREATPPELASVVSGVLAVLEQVSVTGTTCWLVEDVQWGDPSSLEVLTYVARVLRDVPVLLLITARTGSTAAESADADAVLGACGEVIELAPISASATRALAELVLGPSADASAVEDIVGRADGVPLFIEELARSPRPGGRAPSSLSALITRGLKAMSAPAVRLVELAALGGGHLDDGLLRIAFEAGHPEYDEALEEVLLHGVLELDGIGQSYQFRHALVREAAETMMTAGQRAAGHRAWAHALSVGVSRPTPTAVLAVAQHVFAGTDHPPAVFDAALAASAAAVKMGVQRERCLYLETLYELWDVVPDPVSRAEFTREDLVRMLLEELPGAGRGADGLPLAVRELDRAPLDDSTWLYRAYLRLYVMVARLFLARDSTPLSREEATAILERIEGYQGSELTIAALWNMVMLVERSQEAYDLLPRVLDTLDRHVRDSGQTDLLTLVPQRRAELACTAGDVEGYLEQATTCLRIAEERSPQPTRRLQATLAVALALSAAGRHREGAEQLAAAMAALPDPGASLTTWSEAAAHLANMYLLLGELDRCHELARRCSNVEVVPFNKPWLAATEIGAELRRGDLVAAREVLAEFEANRPPNPDSPAVVWPLLHSQAELHATTGDLARMHEALAPLWSTWWLKRVQEHAYASVLLAVRSQHGHPNAHDDHNLRGIAEALQAADRITLRGPVGDAFRNELAAWNTRTTSTDAVAAWAEAVTDWEAVEQPYDACVCRLEFAQALRRSGNRGQSADQLRSCAATAQRHGFGPLLDRARASAHAIGADLDDATSDAVPVQLSRLTSRERAVLTALASGSTNQQIAEQLFMSPKTASVHVSRILAKLGVANRTEAATVAVRHGLGVTTAPMTESETRRSP